MLLGVDEQGQLMPFLIQFCFLYVRKVLEMFWCDGVSVAAVVSCVAEIMTLLPVLNCRSRCYEVGIVFELVLTRPEGFK